METLQLMTVIGARPQFIKAAAVTRAIEAWNETHTDRQIVERIVHTGQHYDENMSKVFFDELRIPHPHVNLEVGSGSHGAQTAAMLQGVERLLLDERPDRVLIYGDTNSTVAAVLAATKLHIPVDHVEAGLRAFNRLIPEEINRVVSDAICDLLLCPTPTAVANLAAEGIHEGVHLVGDVMYDSVLFNARLAESSSEVMARLSLEPKTFYLSTIHRAENTDDPSRLVNILTAFESLPYPVVLPLHPRTRHTVAERGIEIGPNIRVVEPASYLDMLILERSARIVLTDSGGVQKEAFWLDTPCLTLRGETEWLEIVDAGCNQVVGTDRQAIVNAVDQWEAVDAKLPAGRPSDLHGDGHASAKIVELVANQ